jgi:hypothetical protein
VNGTSVRVSHVDDDHEYEVGSHELPIAYADVSRDGNLLATYGYDLEHVQGELKLWDLTTGEHLPAPKRDARGRWNPEVRGCEDQRSPCR